MMADLVRLKRPHTPDVYHLRAKEEFSQPISVPTSPCDKDYTPRLTFLGRGQCPLTASPRFLNDMMPTFMSVYGEKTDSPSYDHQGDPGSPQSKDGAYDLNTFASLSPFSSFHQHRDSLSTTASGSTDSSPTTTASLVDSNSATETPSTSPDTPASSHSITTYTSLALAMRAGPEGKQELRLAPTPPAKKARNLKNLAVNTSSTMNLGRAVSTATFPMEVPAEFKTASPGPLSPSFVKPLHPPRRKSTAMGLTIKTPEANTNRPRQFLYNPPPTPKLPRPATLRHIQSTPSLPIASPIQSPASIISPTNVPSTVPENEPYQPPLSQEPKPDSYPQGPICIYDPHVYLYFEPSAEEASRYDVILNVASEVKNPFPFDAPSPVASITLDQALEALSPDHRNSTPSTPKASDLNPYPSQKQEGRVEYIHIPWEHNTDIVPDLYRVVKVIDDRVTRGKRVLIHCQCGVSRSASLVVAYGLYKNPSMSVQEAYSVVKQKSQWIGPNMNLIMQLQEFRSGLLRPNGAGVTRSNKVLHGRSPVSGTKSESHTRDGDSSQVPQSAPINENPKHVPAPIRTDNLERVSPGPSSAPSDFRFPSSQPTTEDVDTPMDEQPPPIKGIKNKLAIKTDFDRQDIYPAGNIVQQMIQSAPVESPRSAEFAMSPIRPSDVEDSYGITSPRANLFIHSPSEQLMGSIASPTSPRAAEFAMNPIQAPEPDLTFGLTSPRPTTFPSQLPPRLSDNIASFVGQHPALDSDSRHARAALGSQIGMTTRSTQNMHDAFYSSRPALPLLVTAPQLQVPDEMDALMSPRATEFTNNPFHNHFTSSVDHSGSHDDENTGGDVTPKASNEDPRSPAVKGASPITRNIWDVL